MDTLKKALTFPFEKMPVPFLLLFVFRAVVICASYIIGDLIAFKLFFISSTSSLLLVCEAVTVILFYILLITPLSVGVRVYLLNDSSPISTIFSPYKKWFRIIKLKSVIFIRTAAYLLPGIILFIINAYCSDKISHSTSSWLVNITAGAFLIGMVAMFNRKSAYCFSDFIVTEKDDITISAIIKISKKDTCGYTHEICLIAIIMFLGALIIAALMPIKPMKYLYMLPNFVLLSVAELIFNRSIAVLYNEKKR